MRYNLKNQHESEQAFEYLTELVGKECHVDIVRKVNKRTIPQNSYLHLIIGVFALETGNQLEVTKELYKWVSKDIYYRHKKVGDDKFITIRSSADLDKEEMAKTIDNFINYAKQYDIVLPLAMSQDMQNLIYNELEKRKQYL